MKVLCRRWASVKHISRRGEPATKPPRSAKSWCAIIKTAEYVDKAEG